MKMLNTFLFGCLASLSVAAQADAIMIRGATVHTMSGDGVLENTDVFIAEGKVQRIGKDLPLAKGDVRVFDAGGKPLTPGLFAGVTAIGIAEVPAVEESTDTGHALQAMHPEFNVVPAYNPNSSLVPVTRIEGFSFTLLGPDTVGSIFGGQGQMVRLDGAYESFLGSPVLFINVGPDTNKLSGGSRAARWMLLQQAMQEADNPPVSTETALLTRAGRGTLSAFVAGGKVVFNVDRASDILETIRFAEKYGLDLVIAGGAEAWMVARELAAAKVPVLLNPLANLPANFDSLGARLNNAAMLEAAGVVIAISSGETHNARKQRQLAGNAVSYGLPHAEGIAALTINPANIFGVADQQGSIQADRPANLVLWSGDPLEVTSAAEVVVIDGKLIPMESRQTKLRDRYLPENPAMPRAYIKP